MNARKVSFVIGAVCAGLIALAGAAPAQTPGPMPFAGGPGEAVFFIGTAENGVFDAQTAKFLADRAGLVILEAKLVGPAPQYNYEAIVKRIKDFNPALPVLLYSFGGPSYTTDRIGGDVLEGLAARPELLMRDLRTGKPVGGGGGKTLFGNAGNPQWRQFMTDSIAKMVQKTGTDGICLDVSIRNPGLMPGPNGEWCRKDPKACAEYQTGMDLLFSGLKSRLHPKLVVFNGLWNEPAGMLAEQRRLLPHADAAGIEFFGMDPKRPVQPFSQGVEAYLDVMKATPGYPFLVFGRGQWIYTGYRFDYLWQRYLYAAYLLQATPRTLFQYMTSFQVPPHAGRSGGIDYYADWGMDLGAPAAAAEKRGGVYMRRYAKGLVVVSPHGAGDEQPFTLPGAYYTPEGAPMTGNVPLKPGTGLILLNAPPQPPKPLTTTFGQGLREFAGWRFAQTQGEAGGKYHIHIEATPQGQEWEHDFMLEWTRTLRPMRNVEVRVRTKDPKARLLFAVEVDDTDRKVTQAVIAAGPGAETDGGAIPFRSTPRGNAKAPYVKASSFPADGTWQTVRIEGEKAFSGRLSFDRFSHMRAVGAMDIEQITLTNPAK